MNAPASVRADDAVRDGAGGGSFEARARVQAGTASTNSEDVTAAGTAVDVAERSAALQGVEEVVASVPGARVRREGGFGAFAGVALRGAGLEHTTVLLGDLPLGTEDTGPFDLSTVPLAVLDAVEVYRGGAPAWWSEGAIGGVVRLLPRSARTSLLGAELGYGSFGRLELGLTSAVVRDQGARPSFFAHVDVAHADNDYRYVDDNQTRFDTAAASATRDDVTLRQRNARIDQGNGMAHAGIDVLGGRLELLLLGHERNEGVPGPLAAPTLHVHHELTRAVSAVSFTHERMRADGERSHRLQLLVSGTYQDNRLTDLERELGLGTGVVATDVWTRLFARAAASKALTSFLEPTLTASVSRDDYRPSDALAFSAPPRPSGRTSEAVAGELRLHGAIDRTRLELRPSVRAQFSQSSIWAMGNTAAESSRLSRDDFSPTYRVGAAVAPRSWAAFSASASSGARIPSILELFGDRVFQEPNPRLLPERSHSVDGGVVLRGQSGSLRGQLELRGFATFIDDMIAYRRTAQYTVKPENIDRARVLGGELGLRGRYGRHLSLSGSLTAMHTRNQFGYSLPLRPALQFWVRPEVSFFPPVFDRVVLFTEVERVSFVYLDPANRTFLGGRTLVSLGAQLRMWQERARFSLRAQNVFDVTATDVLSRPLPGFNLLASLAFVEAVD